MSRIGIQPPLLSSLSVNLPPGYEVGAAARDLQVASGSNATGASSESSGLAALNRLVGRIRDEALAAIEEGPGGQSSASQRSIDRAVSKISALLGTQLRLGGAENAVVSGLNEKQIASYTVRQLRPNASATFSGARSQQGGAAEVFITDTAGLLSSGGRLDLLVGGKSQAIHINRGTSLHQLIRRLNGLSRVDVRAASVGGKLAIATGQTGALASLQVVASHGIAGQSFSSRVVDGLNDLQVSNFDLSQIDAETPFTVTGTRDSLASAAELTLLGSVGALAEGSATFRLTGALGSANLHAVEGEALATLAQRINDETINTGVDATVSGDDVLLRSVSAGAAANVVVDNVVRETEVSVTGVNAAQFAAFNVDSIPDDTQITLDGTITQAADSALQTYQGDVGSLVVDSAVFTVTGTQGSTQFSITQGESLEDVADRVNDETATTGVVATVNGDDLEFRSTGVGSAASVQITLDSVAQLVTVDGVNPAQVSNFQVLSQQADSVNVLDATITQASTQAELTYSGFLSATTSSADFTLTGELGSASFSVNNFQSLTSVRNAINAETGNTGISAASSGSTLTLTSVGTGSAAIIEVDVTSGTFNTSGGDGNGNAAGLDTQLDINGDAVSAVAGDVTYADATGSYSFTLVDDPLGALDTITVTSASGTFDVTGGDGSGTSYGVDAEATLNGQSIVAVGNDFSFTEAGATFSGSFANGFTGALDTITATSAFDDFTIVGGDGNGSANGTDGSATINGQALTSATDVYSINTAAGPLDIEFQSGFLGALDDISVSYIETETEETGSEKSYFAVGKDPSAAFDGANVTARGDKYLVEKDGVEIEIEFAQGFSGALDGFTVSAGRSIDVGPAPAALSGAARSAAQAALAELITIVSGGKNAGLDVNAGRVLSIAVDALYAVSSLDDNTIFGARRSLSGRLLDRTT